MTVRSQVCKGCWQGCRYRDFRPLADWGFSDVKESLKRQVRDGIRTGSRAHITRATVLGRMHEWKQRDWDLQTYTCPHRGRSLPVTATDLLTWAGALRPVEVRQALGRRPRKGPLTVSELTAYYQLKKEEVPF